ncbi:MAG: DNA alkylation repair protein [Candidatus Omnitrophota bacterium]
MRKVVKEHDDTSLREVTRLLRSKFHEERLAALLILVLKYRGADDNSKKKIFQLYIKNTGYINNWDLVDISAYHIVGAYLENRPKRLLYKLARSKLLWDRRIAILSTCCYIKKNKFSETLTISKILLCDKEDLIHKAVGWMLREVGKRDLSCEEKFLKKHYRSMPRTMLRYAIEKFPESKRESYMKGYA